MVGNTNHPHPVQMPKNASPMSPATDTTQPMVPRLRAAQYVRMSTDHQKYSTENQADKIREYAEHRGIDIVRTYADEGKSGLTILSSSTTWRDEVMSAPGAMSPHFHRIHSNLTRRPHRDSRNPGNRTPDPH